MFVYFCWWKATNKSEDGATVFAVIKTHQSLKNIADKVVYKEVKRQVKQDVRKTFYSKS